MGSAVGSSIIGRINLFTRCPISLVNMLASLEGMQLEGMTVRLVVMSRFPTKLCSEKSPYLGSRTGK
jgi:hypothetical protein